EAERQRLEEERRQREEAERQRLEEERRIQAEIEREQTQNEAYDALSAMFGLIKEKVSRNWNRPAGAGTGLVVVIQVRVTRSGEVVSADIVQSSGNELFDDSTLRAVLKASPLPLPSDP